jgi:glycosyltransferase involved in cell wall biosynthesis
MNSPRLLILTPRFPFPVVGGDRLRIYQMCKALSARYELTLLSLCETPEEMALEVDDPVFSRIERFYLPKWRSVLNTAFALPTKTPLQVAYYRHRGFFKRAAELASTHDGLLAHLIRIGDGVRELPGKKFLEMTDAISLNYSRVRDVGQRRFDLRSWIYREEYKRLRDYEREIVEDFDHSLLVSEIDREFLFKGNVARLNKVGVCSNGVDLSHLPYGFSQEGKDIVFIGNLHSLQNYDGAYFFAKEVLPLIRRELPETRFRIIGRIKRSHADALRKLDGVEVTGEVSNVAQAAACAGVGVCSIRLGAGIQNKVLEYMALGLPVVTTSLGLEGFSARPGEDLLVADSAAQMAESVMFLLRNREKAAEMAKAGRRYVELNHAWDSVLKSIFQKIDTAIRSNRHEAAAEDYAAIEGNGQLA